MLRARRLRRRDQRAAAETVRCDRAARPRRRGRACYAWGRECDSGREFASPGEPGPGSGGPAANDNDLGTRGTSRGRCGLAESRTPGPPDYRTAIVERLSGPMKRRPVLGRPHRVHDRPARRRTDVVGHLARRRRRVRLEVQRRRAAHVARRHRRAVPQLRRRRCVAVQARQQHRVARRVDVDARRRTPCPARGDRRAARWRPYRARRTRDAPTTIVPGELPARRGRRRSRDCPPRRSPGCPRRAARAPRCRAREWSPRVSAMNDQFATAGARGAACGPRSPTRAATIASIVPRSFSHCTIFTSTISASGATPSVAPAIAPATAVPCALQRCSSSGKAL